MCPERAEKQSKAKGLPKIARQRADMLLVSKGLAESREQAQTLIMEGLVFTSSGRVAKASSLLTAKAELEVRGRLPYVGRGGLKLAHALDQFGISPNGMVALDLGASTGGFTDFKTFYESGKTSRPKHRVIELMVHPGSRAFDYEDETEILSGPWKDDLSFPVRLVNYHGVG